MKVEERLLKYVGYHTTSDEASDKIPSSDREFALARELESELNAAHNTIEKIREAMRTPEGDDAQTHAKVLRQMADALVSLWRDGK